MCQGKKVIFPLLSLPLLFFLSFHLLPAPLPPFIGKRRVLHGHDYLKMEPWGNIRTVTGFFIINTND